MKVWIIYDSFFGNTERVAQSIGAALEPRAVVSLARVDQVQPDQIKGSDLLIVGSPTRGFRPSEKTQKFLNALPPESLKGIKVAGFDTRINPEETNSAFLRFMVKLFGYAAKPIADGLQKKGGTPTLPEQGFIVKASEGPLKDGELERAAAWAQALC